MNLLKAKSKVSGNKTMDFEIKLDTTHLVRVALVINSFHECLPEISAAGSADQKLSYYI